MKKTLRPSLVLLVVVLAGVFVPAAFANVIGISGSMEGSIKISPGDWISAGYDFTIPGSHAAQTIQFVNATVTISGPCTNGGNDTVVIPLTAGPYSLGANDGNWYPTGDENSPLSLEGAVQAPANLCGGAGQLNASSGAVFSADLQSTVTTNSIHVQFHYRDPNAKGMGNVDCYALTQAQWNASTCGASWSSTDAFIPDLLLPVAMIGGLLLSALLGGALVIRQLRLRRRLTPIRLRG